MQFLSEMSIGSYDPFIFGTFYLALVHKGTVCVPESNSLSGLDGIHENALDSALEPKSSYLG